MGSNINEGSWMSIEKTFSILPPGLIKRGGLWQGFWQGLGLALGLGKKRKHWGICLRLGLGLGLCLRFSFAFRNKHWLYLSWSWSNDFRKGIEYAGF